MKQTTFKRFSILGLVLIGASAVAAAVIPSKDKAVANGAIVESTVGGLNDSMTCGFQFGANDCTGPGNSNSGASTTTGAGVTSEPAGHSNDSAAGNGTTA